MTEFEYTELAGLTSSVIDLVAYNANHEELFVRFNSGAERVYEDVEAETFEALRDTDSAGSYYNRKIKGIYDTYELDDAKLVLVDEDFPAPALASVPRLIVTKNLYAIHWESDNAAIGGMPTFEATSETDALSQFNSAMAVAQSVGLNADDVKVTAVTHYLD